MSKPRPLDPEKRAAKAERRKRRKAAVAAGAEMPPRRARPTAQMDHATNPRAARHAREGERAMRRERGAMSTCISRHGEFGSHDLIPSSYTCSLCGALDEDALRMGQPGRDAPRAARQNGKTAIPTLGELRERRLPLDGQAVARADFQSTDYDGNDHEGVTDIERANLITSIVDAGGLSHLGAQFAQHKVVIDVDLPVSLVASTTPGHFHLFIDKAMDWATYTALLEALAVAGVVEPGYVAAALRRGHTAVRLPWVRKPAA